MHVTLYRVDHICVVMNIFYTYGYMNVISINKKESIDLKDRKDGYMGGLGGRKEGKRW